MFTSSSSIWFPWAMAEPWDGGDRVRSCSYQDAAGAVHIIGAAVPRTRHSCPSVLDTLSNYVCTCTHTHTHLSSSIATSRHWFLALNLKNCQVFALRPGISRTCSPTLETSSVHKSCDSDSGPGSQACSDYCDLGIVSLISLVLLLTLLLLPPHLNRVLTPDFSLSYLIPRTPKHPPKGLNSICPSTPTPSGDVFIMVPWTTVTTS